MIASKASANRARSGACGQCSWRNPMAGLVPVPPGLRKNRGTWRLSWGLPMKAAMLAMERRI